MPAGAKLRLLVVGADATTQARLATHRAAIERLGADRILTGLGGTGIVATFDSGVPGPVLLFRSELDALPIVELGVDEHGSTCDGVSHKCGHDGHTAILCGLAQRLDQPGPRGTGIRHRLDGGEGLVADRRRARVGRRLAGSPFIERDQECALRRCRAVRIARIDAGTARRGHPCGGAVLCAGDQIGACGRRQRPG